MSNRRFRLHFQTGRVACLVLAAVSLSASANQTDIAGPSGSVAFGAAVVVLPSGNIVVTDPKAQSNKGAVYLMSPNGTMISVLRGSTTNDQVGSGGITVLANGNFVISSGNWNNGPATAAGAATWVNATTGLSGVVSAANSLVGSVAGEGVSAVGVTALTNGNFVVGSFNGTKGEVTWCNGATGCTGSTSPSNSLVGTSDGDYIGGLAHGGGVVALTNGNYVVFSSTWNGTATNAGSVTWGDGTQGVSGNVSSTNSLVGSIANDNIANAGVIPLANGNYVVASGWWSGSASAQYVGAATWGDGTKGITGYISSANSLVGTSCASTNLGRINVVAMTNGNYVVAAVTWCDPTFDLQNDAGAVAWADGATGLSGTMLGSNSLYGSYTNDSVGGVKALANGNYVVFSPNWTNAESTPYIGYVGAVTWMNGGAVFSGPVSTANSLVGGMGNDYVGGDVVALTNGNYVVASGLWNNNSVTQVGAATWVNGGSPHVDTVSATNSLVGTTSGDMVGSTNGTAPGVVALANGNYVVVSPNWSTSGKSAVGAVTWGGGSFGITGSVTPSNSLVGSTSGDNVGSGDSLYGTVVSLTNGNYVVASSRWSNGTMTNAGAVTWGDGKKGISGTVSVTNSLVGTSANDRIGDSVAPGPILLYNGVTALDNGDYVVDSPSWNNNQGAVTLGRGRCGGLIGTIQSTNSVLGAVANGGSSMVFAYDASRDQLIVGQPMANIVSLFRADEIFGCGFD